MGEETKLYFRNNARLIANFLLSSGFSIIPLKNKRPIVGDWKNYNFDPATFFESPASRDLTGYGVVCGKNVKGRLKVWVVDIDVGKKEKGRGSGVNWWNEIAKICFGDRLTPLPIPDEVEVILLPQDTLCVQTGSRGIHIYLKYDDEKMGEIKGGALRGVSVDIKTTDGYVVSPYSLHENGNAYRIVKHDGKAQYNIIDCPPELLERVREFKSPAKQSTEVVAVNSVNNLPLVSQPPFYNRPRKINSQPLSQEGLYNLIHSFHPNRAATYEFWRNGIWAIYDTVMDQDWSSDFNQLYQAGLQLAHEFSSRVPNYDPEGVNKLWFERSQGPIPENHPTLHLLRSWAREDNRAGYYEWKRIWIDNKNCGNYDRNDNYKLLDFISEFHNKHFNSRHEAYEALQDGLERFLRVLTDGGKRQYVMRSNEVSTFKIVSDDPRIAHRDNFVTYNEPPGKDGEIRMGKMGLFEPISELRFLCDRIVFFPMHDYEKALFIQTYGRTTINSDPGMLAKEVEGEIRMDMVNPWRQHMCQALCRNDEHRFECLEDWVTFAVYYRRMKQAALFLYGPEGCGKSIFCDFLVKCVFGLQIARSESLQEGLVAKFNAILDGCNMFAINETSVQGINNGEAGRLRSIIFDQLIMLERKFREKYQVDNHIKIMVTSNNPFAVRLQSGDRHYFFLDCCPSFVGKKPHFDALGALSCYEPSCHYMTYYMRRARAKLEMNIKLEIVIPEVEIRVRNIKGDDGTVDIYISDIKKGRWIIGKGMTLNGIPQDPRVYMSLDDDKFHPFITSDKLIEDYFNWRRSMIHMSRDKQFFGKTLISIFKIKTKCRKNDVNAQAYRQLTIMYGIKQYGFFLDLIGLGEAIPDIQTNNGIAPIPQNDWGGNRN